MIGEKAFKAFCERSNEGLPIRGLFITRDSTARKQQQLDMINACVALDLNSIWYASQRSLAVGPGLAYLRSAHPYLDRELRDYRFHFIHGLEYLLELEDGDAIHANLEMLVPS